MHDKNPTPRREYLLAFLILLVLEVLIGRFVRDRFTRPYVGDMLVTVLLCCLARALWPSLRPALWVFLFAAGVELLQAAGLVTLLELEDSVFSILLGATFDWRDLLCYGIGCLGFVGVERWIFRVK